MKTAKPTNRPGDHDSAKPRLLLVSGRPMTTSLIVADHFGRQHKNVLQAIDNALLETPAEFNRLNFQPVEYVDPKGEARRMYRLTRDGFAYIAMGFTGKEAARWKVAYIDAFNRMEEALRRHPTPGASPAPPTQKSAANFLLQLFLGLGMKRGETAVMWFLSQRRDHEDDPVYGTAALIAAASQGFATASAVQRARKLLAERGDITFEVIPRHGGCHTLDDATLQRILAKGAIEMADLEHLLFPLGPPVRIPESVMKLLEMVSSATAVEPLPEETLAILDLSKKKLH